MSSTAIMRALILAHAPVTALVPVGRIVAGDVPQGTLPAIGIREVSGIEEDTVARRGSSLINARVQVTVYANSYPQQVAIIKALKLGEGAHTGQIAGYAVRGVLRDIIGPDMGDSLAGTYEQGRDFKVAYIEPA